MFYRGPQVYQFYHRTVMCLPSLNKRVTLLTLPYLTLPYLKLQELRR